MRIHPGALLLSVVIEARSPSLALWPLKPCTVATAILLGCESACKKDPAVGVIGIQSGPRDRGPTLASMILGSRGGDAGRGNDCEDSPRIFHTGQIDQGDLPGAACISQGGKEGHPVWGD